MDEATPAARGAGLLRPEIRFSGNPSRQSDVCMARGRLTRSKAPPPEAKRVFGRRTRPDRGDAKCVDCFCKPRAHGERAPDESGPPHPRAEMSVDSPAES